MPCTKAIALTSDRVGINIANATFLSLSARDGFQMTPWQVQNSTYTHGAVETGNTCVAILLFAHHVMWWRLENHHFEVVRAVDGEWEKGKVSQSIRDMKVTWDDMSCFSGRCCINSVIIRLQKDKASIVKSKLCSSVYSSSPSCRCKLLC